MIIHLRAFILCTNHKHLQGDQAKNIPGESMTEEHYMDHDGNLISRKVMYYFISHLAGNKTYGSEKSLLFF